MDDMDTAHRRDSADQRVARDAARALDALVRHWSDAEYSRIRRSDADDAAALAARLRAIADQVTAAWN